MIPLAGKIPFSKSWRDVGEAGRAEILEVGEVTFEASQSALSGQAADSKDWSQRSENTSKVCLKGHIWGQGMSQLYSSVLEQCRLE